MIHIFYVGGVGMLNMLHIYYIRGVETIYVLHIYGIGGVDSGESSQEEVSSSDDSSDNDSNSWNKRPDVKRLCGHTVSECDDGLFWMEWEHFKLGFRNFCVVYQSCRSESGVPQLRFDEVEDEVLRLHPEALAVPKGHQW